MDPSRNSHVKLLAGDLISLSVSPSTPPIISRRGRIIFRAESVGIVVFRDSRPKLLRFLIDDGSACVPCILWLSHHQHPGQNSASVNINVRLGDLLRVRGRITVFRGELQITVKDVLLERDPNTEVLHWLQCVKLARDCYDLPVCATTRETKL